MMGTIGPRLRAAREARNLSVEQAADDTRISLRFLEALEREEFDALPAPVYVRGFLRSYANYLGLEPQTLLDALDGGDAASAPPAPYLRGPDRRERRSAPVPLPPPPVRAAAATPVPRNPQSEWDPEPEESDDWYDEPQGDYRPRPVPGVLVERGYDGGGGTARTVMLAGIGLIVVVVVLAAAFALRGAGGGNTPAGDDDDDLAATATTAGGAGRTVIAVGTATEEGTPADGTPASGTPAAETPEATATPANADTPVPGAANTPVPNQTATNTLEPASTPTATTIPPTPTATATVLPHPFGLTECTAGGGTNCGNAPYRVICAPDGWFVDKDSDFAKPNEWFEFSVSSTFGINGVAEATCP